jgi:hypothetical protein
MKVSFDWASKNRGRSLVSTPYNFKVQTLSQIMRER